MPLEFECVQSPIYKTSLNTYTYLYVTSSEEFWALLLTQEYAVLSVQCLLPVSSNEQWVPEHYHTIRAALIQFKWKMQEVLEVSRPLKGLKFVEWGRSLRNLLGIRLTMDKKVCVIRDGNNNLSTWSIRKVTLKEGFDELQKGFVPTIQAAISLLDAALEALPEERTGIPALQRILEDP
jgi:hypothetical protein